ncbi:hypothetical protein RhoFW510R10_11540 [Rhodanobacter sp. FW510-R10]|uniref:hypothetical protein n=1 Tax=Rhodanobacter sp. FW510-R10 TaxID=1524462 RepID=UPI0007A9AF11|nr:hypothetical protein [Rhodanobacter sp. FW510-R10]KZC32543.1 hypothetical protein RhoFW510R10_11540 [Rhodanobacter sp. FW510-R10]
MQTKLYVVDDVRPAAALTPQAVTRRRKQLRSIDRRVFQARNAISGPRTGYAVSVGLCTGAALLGLATLIDRSGFLAVLGVSASVRAGIGYLPLLAGLVTWAYLLRWGAYPTSWTTLIDQELAAYDPVDVRAYRNLQQRTREAGHLDLDEVSVWRAVEWGALGLASDRLTPPKSSFTSKTV